MNDNVVDLDCVTKLDLDPNRVLKKAIEYGLESSVIIGWDDDGDFYFASSIADAAQVIFLLEMAKKKLLDLCDPKDN